jgi:hypothetical protein
MIANGLGPWWFPDAWRRWLTKLSALFFDEASWRIHDESYAAGSPARSVADFGFFKAMIRDASRATTLARTMGCLALAFLFYVLVRAFGWASYGRGYS